MTRYTYSPLKSENQEIRLFTLLPGKFDAPIKGTIEHTSLRAPKERPDPRITLEELQQSLPPNWKAFETVERRYIFEHQDTEDTSWTHPDRTFHRTRYEGYGHDPEPDFEPKFEALSYVWGSAEDPETLLIHNSNVLPDATASSTLSITRNLASALRHLRHSSASRVLWVDAVCIDQSNIAERNAQVPRMRLIYKLARRVVVWLGPSADSSALALSTLEYLGEQLEATIDYWRLRAPGAVHPDWFHRRQTTLPYNDATWKALDLLFQRPWFERVWVIQEVHLSNRWAIFQCGYDTPTWSSARRAIYCLSYKTVPLSRLRDRLRSTRILALDYSNRTLPALLAEARQHQCTDPRDKMYGLLSLMPADLAEKIRVDYSLPPAEVYKGAFLTILEHTRRLDFIRMVLPSRRLDDLPSWVPDWSYTPPIRIRRMIDTGYSAGGVSSAQARLSSESVLNVTGVKLAVVKGVGDSLMNDPDDKLEIIRKTESQISRATAYINGEPMSDAFVKTCTTGWTKEMYPYVNWPSIAEWWEIFTRPVTRKTDSTRYDGTVTQGRAFITTDQGYFGMACTGVQKGDIVCALLGCGIPIVLRQQPTSTASYEVVGDCYLEGAMHGEGLLGPLPRPWRVQMHVDKSGYDVPHYVNDDTDETTFEDPRLGGVPDDWEKLDAVRAPIDPIIFARYRNRVTGEVINSDPRFFPEALESMGVKLQTFRLV